MNIMEVIDSKMAWLSDVSKENLDLIIQSRGFMKRIEDAIGVIKKENSELRAEVEKYKKMVVECEEIIADQEDEIEMRMKF